MSQHCWLMRLVRLTVSVIILASLLLGSLPGSVQVARAQDPDPGAPTSQPEGQTPAAQATPPAGESGWRVSTNQDTGKVRFMGADPANPLLSGSTLGVGAQADVAASAFFTYFGPRFGIDDPAQDLSLIKANTGDDGSVSTRYQQMYKGVPVLGGEMIVQTDAQMDVVAATADLSQDLAVDVTPTVDAESARQAALAEVLADYLDLSADKIAASDASLWIYDPSIIGHEVGREKTLVWKVTVTPNDSYPMSELVLVDAHSAKVALHFNQVEKSLKRTIYDCWSPDDVNWYCDLARTETSGPYGYADVDNAFNYLGTTYNFYKTRFNRDSVNNAGLPLIAFTSIYDMENAYWDDYYKKFFFGPGYTTQDVVAHEYTHGVTQFESNLIYFDEPGAINESLSDIFGEFVEKTAPGYSNNDPSWLMGEGLPGGAIRSMSNPSANPYDQPDKMSSPYYACDYNDNAEVHQNSGVGNHAAYLMAVGGNFNGQTVAPLGIEKTAKIYYEAQANLLTSSATYADLNDVLQQACVNISNKPGSGFTGGECGEVQKALVAVEMDTTPCVGARGYIYPLATKLETPTGTTSTLTPDLVWRLKNDVTDYQVWLKDAKSATVLKQWLNDADPGVCNGSTCRLTTPELQYGGVYSWAVQTKNPVSEGPWTPFAKFTVGIPGAPPAPAQNAPNGSTATATPDFSWSAIPGASDYVLTVKNTNTQKAVYTLSYKASAVCSDIDCEVTPANKLVSGNYAWTIQAKYQKTAGAFSGDMDFAVSAAPATQPTLYAPTGPINIQPTFSWSSVIGATSYIFSLTGTSGKITQEFQAGNLGCGGGQDTCSMNLTPRILEGGSHTWTVQAKNLVGLGPVSLKSTFILSKPLDQPDLNSPVSETTGTSLPDFSWNPVDLATSYTITLAGPTKYTKTYAASAVCSGTCTVNPMMPLKVGDYTWTLKAANKAGFSTASATFHAPAWGQAPTQPLLSTPVNKAKLDRSALPPLTWNLSANTTDFLVTISAKGFLFSHLYSVASPELNDCSGGCSLAMPALPGTGYGTYSWFVTPFNHGVPGKNSAGYTFSVVLPAPVMIAPAPAASVATAQLDFSWTMQVTAARYDLAVYPHFIYGVDPLPKSVYKAIITPSKSCGTAGDPCTWSIPALPPGSYTWTLFGSNNAGGGLVSYADFDTIPYLDNEFNSAGDYQGWSGVGSNSDWEVAGGKLYTTGNDDCVDQGNGYLTCYANWSIADYTYYSTYGYVDVQASLSRTGGCIGCSNSITVRADFWPTSYYLKSGYLFNVSNNGFFSVFRLDAYSDASDPTDYSAMPLQPWTYSKAIKKGSAANVVRVVAIGSSFRYYINGVLVWVGSDATYDTGKVGVGMYGNYWLHDKLSVDWVRIFETPILSIPAVVDPAQQELNLEAINKVGSQSVMGSEKYVGPAPQAPVKIKR